MKRVRKSAVERVMEQLDPQVDYEQFVISATVDSIPLENLMDSRYRIWCPVKLAKAKGKDGKQKLIKKPVNRLKMLVPCSMARLPDGTWVPPDIRYREVGMTSQPKARWTHDEAVEFCRDYPLRAKQPSRKNPPAMLAYPCGSPMLGIVLPVQRSRLVAWDVDGCFDDQGNLDPSVTRWIAGVKGYIEKSPSGKGLRGFFIGDIIFSRAVLQHPDGFAIEVYSHGPNCWVTFTDNPINNDRTVYRQPALERELDMLYIEQQGDRQTKAEAQKATVLAKKKSAPAKPVLPPVLMGSLGVLSPEDTVLVDRIMQSEHGQKFRDIWDGYKPTYRSYGYYRAQAVYYLLQRILWWSQKDVNRAVAIVLRSPLLGNPFIGRVRSPVYVQKTAQKIADKMTHSKRPERTLDQRILDLVRDKGEVTQGMFRRYLVRKDHGNITDDQLQQSLDALTLAGKLVPSTKVAKYRKKPVMVWSLATRSAATAQLVTVNPDDVF